MTRTMGVLAIAAVLAVAGCGGDDSSSSGSGSSGSSGSSSSSSSGGGSTLALAADPGGALKFDKTSLKAKAGSVTIDFTNDASIAHAVGVKGNGVDKEGETITGSKNSLTVDLKPGTYEFYCPVPGHEEAGMKGELVVE
jgi:uncharacterized cupredoxin-like copper-binding protein